MLLRLRPHPNSLHVWELPERLRSTQRDPPHPTVLPQEQNGEKTNNGIHYRLQLLYSNGGCRAGGPGARTALTPPCHRRAPH